MENDTYERLRRNPSLLRQELEECTPGDDAEVMPATRFLGQLWQGKIHR